jgi:hypothetical protein
MPNYQGISAFKQVNRKKSKQKTSKYFGVHFHTRIRKTKTRSRRVEECRAAIRIDGVMKYLGCFPATEDGEKTAALLYITTAEKHYQQPVRIDDPVYNALCTRNIKTKMIDGAQ